MCNETKVEADQDMIKRMSMQLEAQKKMIEALLAAQRQDSEVKSEPQWWDHSAQREPLLVKLSWDEINSNITDLFPKVAKELENDEEFEDMLNFDQNVEDSGVTSDIVFRYFHLLEKVSHDKKIRAVRPFQFMSEPVKRRNVILKHKLTLKDYEDSLPQSSFENVDLILALVVMDLNRKYQNIFDRAKQSNAVGPNGPCIYILFNFSYLTLSHFGRQAVASLILLLFRNVCFDINGDVIVCFDINSDVIILLNLHCP